MSANSSDFPNDADNDDTRSEAAAEFARDNGPAIDLLIEHGFDVDAAIRSTPNLESSLRATNELFGKLDSYPVEPADEALVDATLARIAAAEADHSQRMHIGSASVPSVGAGRWRDLVALSCAAILLLSVGVPIASWLQGRRDDQRCGDNMRQLAGGMSAYFADHNSMPIAAGFPLDLRALTSWNAHRNGKHLQPLVEGNYCDATCLGCGADTTGEGYAYQVPGKHAAWTWRGGARMPALADRNPIIDLTRRGRVVGTLTMNSPEHGGRGQNVVFTDGSVVFEGSPLLLVPTSVQASGFSVFRIENIWLPRDSDDDLRENNAQTAGNLGGIEDELGLPNEWLGLDVFLIQ
jgi:type II secretory pathway pseudopilin PulG